jgi:hypothetical protein
MENIKIKSSVLTVEISKPGTFYSGSRFDWTGFITQITLNGKHHFCVDESLIKGFGTGGRGLCNEFGIHEPIGYEEARVGECFPKLGIGLLEKKSDEPYDFFEAYAISPYEVDVKSDANRVSFMSKSCSCRGYAARLQKNIEIIDNRMEIHYTLENTGDKTLDTTEYVHNFVSIDDADIGPHNRLSFSFELTGNNVPDVFRVMGNSIEWRRIPDKEFYWTPRGFEGHSSSWWRLENKNTGVGMQETCSFPVLKAAIWGKTHVVSPEMFIHLLLKPGEVKTWTRSYEFFA